MQCQKTWKTWYIASKNPSETFAKSVVRDVSFSYGVIMKIELLF